MMSRNWGLSQHHGADTIHTRSRRYLPRKRSRLWALASVVAIALLAGLFRATWFYLTGE